MDTPWRIELLGGLRASQGDRVVTRFRYQKTGSMLAYMAFYRDRSHPREQLIELLWPESDPSAGRLRLRVALNSLRRQLEPPGIPAGAVVVADRTSIRLNPAAYLTDVERLEAALRSAARAPTAGERARCLTQAVALYRAELLPGCLEEWVFPERQRLAEAVLQALSTLITHLGERGDLHGALQYARRAVTIDPLREEAHHDVIRLLARAGEPEAALLHYRELERCLAEELGVEPSRDLRAFARAIEQQRAEKHHAEIGVREVREGAVDSGMAAGSPSSPQLTPSSPSLPSAPAPVPAGTVTFLLISLEDVAAPERGQELLRPLLRGHGSHELQARGATLQVVFGRASDALAAAMAGMECVLRISYSVSEGQMPDAQHTIPDTHYAIRNTPRMALYTGEVAPGDAPQGAAALQHARRLLLAAHPGQILLSEATAVLARPDFGPAPPLADLGLYCLQEQGPPERLFQVCCPGISPREIPPPRLPPARMGSLPLQVTRFFGREKEIARLYEMLLGEAVSDVGWGIADTGSPVDSGPIQNPNAQTRGPAPRFAPPPEIQNRLVTLTGPGGSGKTRLAIEVAARLWGDWGGAVWFVPLADLDDASLIPRKLLDVLALPPLHQTEPLEQAALFLSRQPSLLVLDNLEHLVDEGAMLIRALLERTPTLSILVTSRQRLGLTGEQEFVVAPLPVPVESRELRVESPTKIGPADPSTLNSQLSTLNSCPSVALFVDRAQSVRPDFQLTLANAAGVAALCARLEGLPLALELAASRAWVLTPTQMLERLQVPPAAGAYQPEASGRAGRFELLVSRRRELAARHRSLRATLDWSYQLLPPNLQRFLTRLSIFRGGWTVEGAEAVAEEPKALDYLEQLRDYSLVISEHPTPEIRFRLLETVREYAAEQLPPVEQAGLAARHAAYYLRVAEATELCLKGLQQELWLGRLEGEHDNLRAALAWCLDGRHEITPHTPSTTQPAALEGHRGPDEPAFEPPTPDRTGLPTAAEIGLRLAGALASFWVVRGYFSEGARWIERALSANGAADPAARANALRGGAVLCAAQGDLEQATRMGEQSLAISQSLRDHWAVSQTLAFLGDWALHRSDFGRAEQLLGQGRALCSELHNLEGLALTLVALGRLAWRQGHWEQATTLLEESLSLYRKSGDWRGIALGLAEVGYLLAWRGEFARATELLEEQLSLVQRLNDKLLIGHALFLLGFTAWRQGDEERALAFHHESLALRREIGQMPGIADSLASLAKIAAARGDHEAALRMEEESLAIWRNVGDPSGIAGGLDRLAWLMLQQGDQAPARQSFEESLAISRELGEKRHIASSTHGLGILGRREGDYFAACALLEESLAIRRAMGDKLSMAACLEELAAVAEAEVQPVTATQLLAAAVALRQAVNAARGATAHPDAEKRIARLRQALGEAGFAAAWAEGWNKALEQALADARECRNP